MLKNLSESRLQMKNTVAAAAAGMSQTRIQLVVFFSAAFWFIILYSHFGSFNNHPGIARLSPFANSVASTTSGRRQSVIQTPKDPCSGRYIYMYDLPSEFNLDLLKNCRTLVKWFSLCPYVQNLGFGPRLPNPKGILQDNAWFNTNQFFLELIFHNRMKQYECLTNDSAAASVVFVPFYAGFDVGRNLMESNLTVRDSGSLRITKWLAKRPEWRRMWGKDHFVVAGRISWDFRRQADMGSYSDSWGNRFLFLPETKNMTVLGIESSSCPDCGNDISIPYPTYFHPRTDFDVLEWQDRMRRLRNRPYLFSFAGQPRPDMPRSARNVILEQCGRDWKEKCRLLDCVPGDDNKCDNPASVIELFMNSTFCLQPRGDSYTRRSTFDSILAGCIPVFFYEMSAYLQYHWYLPQNHTKYSVFIPDGDVISGRSVSIEKVLMGVSEEEVLAMREEVIRLIPRIVYADPMSRNGTNLEDAFDFAVKGVLERVEKIRMNSTGLYS